MKYRKLRIAWSVAWGVLAVLLCALWVRSLFYSDVISAPLPKGRGFLIDSCKSHLELQTYDSLSLPWHLTTNNLKEAEAKGYQLPTFKGLGVGYYPRPKYAMYTVPYWFVVLTMMAMTAVPWSASFKRFSLRTLLIATTLIAMGLGLLAWSTS